MLECDIHGGLPLGTGIELEVGSDALTGCTPGYDTEDNERNCDSFWDVFDQKT